jgi:hypothetical protein
MSCANARVRVSPRTRALSFVLACLGGIAPAAAADIPLPARTIASIAAACPECVASSWLACGSQDLGWGRAFAKHALLGTPKRGYLLAFGLTGEEFRTLARSTPFPALEPALRAAFDRIRMVVLEDGFTRARVLPKPRAPTVVFPEPLHACVYGSAHPWGCCVGTCKDEECCEKSLGSPTVDAVWHDGEETLTLHYSHTIGLSWLDRRTDERSVRYACLVDGKGKLKPHAGP